MTSNYSTNPVLEKLSPKQKEAFTRLALVEIAEAVKLLAEAQGSVHQGGYGLICELLEKANNRIRLAHIQEPGAPVGTKLNPGEFDFYSKSLPDEPLFSLLGRDPSAPKLVLEWAKEREREIDCGDREEKDRKQVSEARLIAAKMREWRKNRLGAWKKSEEEKENA